MPIFENSLTAALIAGLLALWAAVRLSNPRTGLPESGLLGLLLGLAALLSPVAALVPFYIMLGLIAVWPWRALLVLAVAALVALEGLMQGYLFWPALHTVGTTTMAAASMVLAVVLAYQLYHGRWWSPLKQTLVGLSSCSLLLMTAGLGTLPSLIILSFCLVPLPVWAWWLAKQRQAF